MNRFQPQNSKTTQENLIAQMNRNFAVLDRESVTKVFKGAGGALLIQGQVDDNRFGTLMKINDVDRFFSGLYAEGRFGTISYDETGVPMSLDGMAPDDGRIGKWVAKPGENVLTLLGG